MSDCSPPLRAYGHLCAVPGLVSSLQDLAAVYDISPLLRYLLPHLVHSVVIGSGLCDILKIDQSVCALQSCGSNWC